MSELNSRRDFIQKSILQTTAGIALAPAIAAQSRDTALEWRNKQPGMAYRRLGRTNLMISEIICGGDPISTSNYKHLSLALEMGLNYLDMAPAYGNGDCEIAYGRFLANNGKRNDVFLQTKVSRYLNVRNRLYRDIYKGLSPAKQNDITAKADELRRTNIAETPGYYLTYFPGQHQQFPDSYLSSAMAPEYGEQVNASAELRKVIIDSLEGSLKRAGTDHFDLLMCPHGANSPDELDGPQIHETFLDLKKQGKIRFLGVTSHNDPAGVLRKAAALGHYDAVMCAYNVINGGYVAQAILDASAKDVGIIAMKTAHAVATHHTELQPLPQWRTDKVNKIVPGDMKPPLKAYLWVLQNPHITALNSNLWDETYIRENLSLAGKKVELQPA